MSKPAQLSILYAEDDLELLASQAAQMQKGGHAVDQVTGRKAVEESVRRKSYDLVILGDTLNKNDRHHLPYMVKKTNQATKVLVLHSTHGHPSVDKEIDSPYSPEKLMEAIASFAPQQAAKAAVAAAGARH
jgi:DNA-binding response OmpR family regulator